MGEYCNWCESVGVWERIGVWESIGVWEKIESV